MRRVQIPLQEEGHVVRVISLLGGLPTDSSITDLQKQLSELPLEPGTTVVLDLLGNFAYRYEQEDGGMALPIRLADGHHLLGSIGVCSDTALKAIVGKLIPVIGDVSGQSPCVVMPPVPRFLTGGCCEEATHSTNTGTTSYKEDMLEKISHIRKVLRDEVVGSSLTGVWVPDIISGLAGGGGDLDTKTKVGNISELFSSDRVHLTKMGYKRLAVCIAEGVKSSKDKMISADCTVAGVVRSFFWRGFVSSHGSVRQNFSASSYKLRSHRAGHGGQRGSRGGGHHPYHGYGGRGGRRN